jgi:hypothetical protein
MGRADPQLHQQFKVYDAPPVVLPIFRWFANPSIIFFRERRTRAFGEACT